MTIEQVMNDISSLSANDQIRIAQAIWDRLPRDAGTELSPVLSAELDRRWAEYEANPATALTENDFRERIRVARGQ
jgi:putative addiction module component (TIGR02574 family)